MQTEIKMKPTELAEVHIVVEATSFNKSQKISTQKKQR